MLIQTINKYSVVKPKVIRFQKGGNRKPKFVIGSPEHRKFLFDMTVEMAKQNPNCKQNECVYLRGFKHKEGYVLGITSKFEDAGWTGDKCLVVEIYWPNEQQTWESSLHHPSDVRKVS